MQMVLAFFMPFSNPPKVTTGRSNMTLKLAIAVLMPVHTQNAPDSSATAQALMSLENKWVVALAKSDIATLDSIFADTYVDTFEGK
jgi:hypothetical protein